MADTFDGLSKRYNGFQIPAAEVLIGGKDLATELGGKIESIQIELSDSDPSRVVINIWDVYNITSRSISSEIKNNVILGSKIEIKLGYGSQTTTAFIGFIDVLGIQISEESAIVYEITGVDVRKLLKEERRCRLLDVTSYSEAFTSIMAGYSWACKSSCESTEEILKAPLFQECSDYEFIMKELIEQGNPDWSFQVTDGAAKFIKRPESCSPILELGPGAGVLGIKIESEFINRKVQTLGYSMEDGGFLGEAEAAASNICDDSQIGLDVFRVLGADSQERADKIAMAYARNLKADAVKGTVYTVGLPEIKPGLYLKIAGVDPSLNQIYAVKAVRHSFNEEGFTTKITIGG